MKLYPDKFLLYTASFVASVIGTISSLFLLLLDSSNEHIKAWDIFELVNIFWPFAGGLLGAYHFLSTSRDTLDINNENIRIQRGKIKFEVPINEVTIGRNVMLVSDTLIHLRIGDRWICYKDEDNKPMRLENLEPIGIRRQSGLAIFAQLLKQGSTLAVLFLIWVLVGSYLFIRAGFLN